MTDDTEQHSPLLLLRVDIGQIDRRKARNERYDCVKKEVQIQLRVFLQRHGGWDVGWR